MHFNANIRDQGMKIKVSDDNKIFKKIATRLAIFRKPTTKI